MDVDASDAYDATPAEVAHKYESANQALQHRIQVEARRSQLENLGVLKATSENAQETRVATRASKKAEAAIKRLVHSSNMYPNGGWHC